MYDCGLFVLLIMFCCCSLFCCSYLFYLLLLRVVFVQHVLCFSPLFGVRHFYDFDAVTYFLLLVGFVACLIRPKSFKVTLATLAANAFVLIAKVVSRFSVFGVPTNPK